MFTRDFNMRFFTKNVWSKYMFYDVFPIVVFSESSFDDLIRKGGIWLENNRFSVYREMKGLMLGFQRV